MCTILFVHPPFPTFNIRQRFHYFFLINIISNSPPLDLYLPSSSNSASYPYHLLKFISQKYSVHILFTSLPLISSPFLSIFIFLYLFFSHPYTMHLPPKHIFPKIVFILRFIFRLHFSALTLPCLDARYGKFLHVIFFTLITSLSSPIFTFLCAYPIVPFVLICSRNLASNKQQFDRTPMLLSTRSHLAIFFLNTF